MGWGGGGGVDVRGDGGRGSDSINVVPPDVGVRL